MKTALPGAKPFAKSCLHGAGPTQKPKINAVSNPGDTFGATEFGFSKKNELLVGECLTHPYPLTPASASHHLKVVHLNVVRYLTSGAPAGRTAQLGFLAAVIGEKVTGFGPLKQFGLETGVPSRVLFMGNALLPHMILPSKYL